MNELKTILEITKKDGEQFKRWAHSITAAATLNNTAKTPSLFLRSIYKELYNNDNLSILIRCGLCASNNHLDFLANYKPTKEATYDFIFLKAEFVRLMIERATV